MTSFIGKRTAPSSSSSPYTSKPARPYTFRTHFFDFSGRHERPGPKSSKPSATGGGAAVFYGKLRGSTALESTREGSFSTRDEGRIEEKAPAGFRPVAPRPGRAPAGTLRTGS